MKRILVTAGETRVAYNICRALSKCGYKVYVGNRTRFSMAAVSKYCIGDMVYASPFTEWEKFIEDITSFIEQKQIDILAPVLEESYTIAKNREKFDGVVKFFLPDYADILRMHDKGSLARLAAELHIPSPKTIELADIFAETADAASLTYPAILKPKQGGGGWGMKKFPTKGELLSFARRHITMPKRYIVQEIVEGQLIGVCGICNRGKLLASDSYILATSYPLHVGQSTTRESRIFGDALQSLERLLGHLGWSGLCQVDFIVEKDTGVSYMLDANPRFWGSIAQNIAAGVNYPYYYCQLALGQENFPVGEAVPGTRTRWLGGDIMRRVAEFRAADNKFAYISHAMSQKASYALCDDWDRRDPLPFLAWGLGLFAKKILKHEKDALPGIWE